MGKDKNKIYTCQNCGDSFYVKRHKKSERKYCSHSCYNESRANKVSLNCDYCGNEFQEYPSRIKEGRGKYCSKECYNNKIQEGKVKGNCSICNNEFIVRRSAFERMVNSKSGKSFCSRKCFYEFNKGENVYNWTPDRDELLRIRQSANYIEWRKEVFERDDYTCQSCGEVGGKLNSHHIEGFKNNPELRLNIDNGITLCKECHVEYHTIYGLKDANSNDFYNWLEMKGDNNG